MRPSRSLRPLTATEVVAVSLLVPCAALIVAAYALDAVGIAFRPAAMLPFGLVVCGGTAGRLWPRDSSDASDLPLWLAVCVPMFAWLLWLSWPTLLPLSTGPDLTHHLLLIHYIETHWRLVHDPSLERFLGEMAQYTPGSHILAALAGAWSRTDGLRALHVLQAATVTLKVGFLLAIGLRLLPPRAPRVLAALGPVLLLAAPRYFLGGFTEYGFLAQVVAELFTVAMWWAIVAWSDRPSSAPLAVFAVAGAAAFLTWPVYVGPPALAGVLVVALREEEPIARRLRALVVAYLPLAVVSAVYIVGRLGWLQLAGTGGAAPWPTVGEYSVPLVALAAAGFLLGWLRRRGRSTAVFGLAVVAQTAALYVLARRAGAAQPYMALKMGYLWLWPMAACAVVAVGEAWASLAAAVPRITDGRGRQAALVVVGVALVLTVRPLLARPSRLHPLPPAVSWPLYEAGRWARANVPSGCIEYLVGDDETAYWLHLAVLGNPRMSGRTGDNSTYEPKDAVVRWLTPNGLPFAIVDLPAVPRDVRNELDIVRAFGTAAVARRRGAANCDAAR